MLKKIIIIFFLSLFIPLAVFILIEIPFRVYDYGFRYRNGPSHDFDEITTYLFKAGYCIRDPKLIWRYAPGYIKHTDYRFNSLGLRTNDGTGPSRKKDIDVYRIIVFGGSHPFGVFVSYEQTYSYQLEVLFESDKLKLRKKVEVINAAVPGYSTLQVLNLLKYHMLKYKPDLIIIDAGINDAIKLNSKWPWKDSQVVNFNAFQCKIVSFLERSSFFWYYRQFLTAMNPSNIFNKENKKEIEKLDTRVSKEENQLFLEKMKKLADDNKSKIVFLSQMVLSNKGKLNRAFGAIVEPYLDVYAQLKDKQDISDYFADAIHASPKGHKEIARIIYNYIANTPSLYKELE